MKVRQIFYTGMILFVLFLICVLIKLTSTKEPQGRLIKHFPKNTSVNRHPECNACRIAHEYSLNINLKHYGDKE